MAEDEKEPADEEGGEGGSLSLFRRATGTLQRVYTLLFDLVPRIERVQSDQEIQAREMRKLAERLARIEGILETLPENIQLRIKNEIRDELNWRDGRRRR